MLGELRFGEFVPGGYGSNDFWTLEGEFKEKIITHHVETRDDCTSGGHGHMRYDTFLNNAWIGEVTADSYVQTFSEVKWEDVIKDWEQSV